MSHGTALAVQTPVCTRGSLRLSRLLSMGPTVVCREQLGRVAEALQDYREIVLLEPSNKVATAKVTELELEDVHAST